MHKSLCLLNICLSAGHMSPSEHINLRRVCWCSCWSLGHDSSHAKDAFIQPHGSHHHLHWLHRIHFHGEFAHLEHMVTPTPFAALFYYVLPWVLDWVLQVVRVCHMAIKRSRVSQETGVHSASPAQVSQIPQSISHDIRHICMCN